MISKLASLKTEIKGHHFYKYDYTVNEQISCGMDENNAHSKNAISVNSKMNGSKIGHLPEGLSKKLFPLMKDGLVSEVEGMISSDAKASIKGTWNRGGGVVLPCKINIHGPKSKKLTVIKKLKE